MLKGLARLIVVYEGELKDETFKEKLGIVSCKEITQEAKIRKAGSMGFTETLLTYYNKKTRFGLEWAKLYKKQKGPVSHDDGEAAVNDVDEEESFPETEGDVPREQSFRQMTFSDLVDGADEPDSQMRNYPGTD